MVNCRECGQIMFCIGPYRFVNKEDGEDIYGYGQVILGYDIPMYFCSVPCRYIYEDKGYKIEKVEKDE